MFNVVLYEPEIPANTGNIGRTCVVTGSVLHLVGPLGFSLDDRMLHRAGLGYWRSLDVRTYRDWAEFLQVNRLAVDDARLHYLTKKARRTYAEARYANGDFLVFGKESTGIPEELLATAPERRERIPMLPDAATIGPRGAAPGHLRQLHRPRRLPHQRAQPLQRRGGRPLRGAAPDRLRGHVDVRGAPRTRRADAAKGHSEGVSDTRTERSGPGTERLGTKAGTSGKKGASRARFGRPRAGPSFHTAEIAYLYKNRR